MLIGVVQYLCEEILFSSPTYASTLSIAGLSGSSTAGLGQGMLSPAGHVISPLASRGSGKPTHAVNSGSSSGGILGQSGSGKSYASIAMMQTSLKSLLAGEAFPSRLMRLLKSEISAALEHSAMENDHQMAIIHERLSETTVNYYRKWTP